MFKYTQIHYRCFDFAHDDGITMINNKPCYIFGFGMEKLAKEICNIVHQQRKAVWCNGPTSLEVMKHIDGFMAEGAHWSWLGSVQYLGLKKPLVALQQVRNSRDHERVLKHCLLTGAQPSVPWKLEGEKGLFGESKETHKLIPDTRIQIKCLFSAYTPLLNLLKKRVWVCEAHALTLSPGVKGNIFKVGNNYVVTIVSMDKSIFDTNVFPERIEVLIRLSDASKIKKATLFSVNSQEKKEVTVELKEDQAKMMIPNHLTSSLILIEMSS